MRAVALNELKAGIDRRRVKGGASPESLYDLENGYVDQAGRIVSRPGTSAYATLPAGTKGLCSFDGAFVVFSHQVVEDMPDGFTCEVLSHPDNPAIELHDIHFAGPFLGYLYVAAEFSTGDVYHYWLQASSTWEASTVYGLGDHVQPTAPNGLAYRATRLLSPYPEWAPNIERTVGDRIEPTTPNDFYYEVVATGAGTSTGVIGGTGGSNRSFETGLEGWTPAPATAAGWSSITSATAYDGSFVASYDPVAGGSSSSSMLSSQFETAWGTQIYANLRTRGPATCSARISIDKYDASDVLISSSLGGESVGEGDAWGAAEATTVAPQNCTYFIVRAVVNTDGTNPMELDFLSITTDAP